MITKKTKYAFKALIHLVEKFGDGPILIQEISEAQQIPKKFLEAILLELKQNQIIKSKKGRNGGCSLARKPSEISLAQVYRLVEGPIAPVSCVSLNFYAKCEDCIDEGSCKLRLLMINLRDAHLQILEKTSLEDLGSGKYSIH